MYTSQSTGHKRGLFKGQNQALVTGNVPTVMSDTVTSDTEKGYVVVMMAMVSQLK